MGFQNYFKRYELKYLITKEQYIRLCGLLCDRTVPDEYGKSTILNIYYDTPDYRLIRRSLEKPVYKEKLRLRCYGVPTAGTTSFLEIKKKYDSVVYKRRIDMPYESAVGYVNNPLPCSQVGNEIAYFVKVYENLRPAMFLSYSRTALYDRYDRDIRITFDTDITWRNYDTDLRRGVYGYDILQGDTVLMEIKIKDSIPLWLSSILTRERIFSSSFSKYGRAYQAMVSKETNTIGGYVYV